MNSIYTVIVTYNAVPYIRNCLSCILQSNTETNIIIIDNTSTDNTLDCLKEFSDKIHLIKNKENKGFGQANNQGIKLALELGAEYIFLQNQDVYIYPDTLELLCQSINQHPNYGILSALQLKPDGTHIDDKMQGYIARCFSKKDRIEKSGENDISGSSPLSLRFVNAAAWMLSRQCILTTGLFHPAFFHYGEDNHFCSRAQFHDFKTGYLPSAKVIHDRAPKTESSISTLRKKLETVPLYTLLDIRKPFLPAYIIGWRKLNSTWQKLKNEGDMDAEHIYLNQKLWFTKNLNQSLQIRKETKKIWKESYVG